MARLWSSGAEHNSVSTEAATASGSSNPTITTSTVRSGTYAFSHAVTSAFTSLMNYQFSTGANTGYFRIYFYITGNPAVNTNLCSVNDGTFSLGQIRLTTTGTLQLRDSKNNAQKGSDSSSVSLNTWNYIELFIDDTTISSATITGVINGVQFATGTCNWTGASKMTTFQWGIGGTGSGTFTMLTDDIAINDSSGSFQNSYPGSGKIIHLKPNADGDTTAWPGGAGYADVDEVTPDDATTFVASSTLDQTEEYELESPTALGSSDIVNCVQVGCRFANSSTSDPPSFVVRIKATSGGTVEESANIATVNTTYTTNSASAPRNYPLTLYDLPGASTTAWTKADLETAQIGVRISVDPNLTTVRLSTMWLLVDYTPATASGVSLCFWKPYANQPPTSNFATLDTRNLHPVLDFDTTTQETAIFRGVMPRSYSGGDITVYLHWAATSATSGTGGWDVAFERIGDGSQDIDSDGFASAQQIGPDTVPATTGNVIITSVTMSNSACDSIAAGEAFRLRVRRDVTNDNATGDLELLGVELRETT